MSNASTEKRNLLKNASWLFSGGMGASLFAIIEISILARFLGLEQFGMFSIVVSYVMIVNGLIDFRIKEAVVRYVGQYWGVKEKTKTLSFIKLFYLIDFFSGVLAFSVTLFLADIANRVFIKSENAFELILIYSFSLLVSTVNQNSNAILRVFNRFRDIAFVEMFRLGLRVVFVVMLLVAGFGIEGVFIAYVAAAFISFAVLQFLVNRILKKEALGAWFGVELGPAIGEIKSVMWFALNSTFSGFIGRVFDKNFPILVLGYFFGSEASGLYKTAAAFSKIVARLKSPAQSTIYPALVNIQTRRDYKTFKKIVSYSTKVLMKLFIPVGAVVFVFADGIIHIFFGAEYTPAANAMRTIVIAEMLSGLLFWVPSVYLALGKIWLRTGVVVLSGLFYVSVLFYLVSPYSYEGAAVARLAPYLVILPAAALLFRDIKQRSRNM